MGVSLKYYSGAALAAALAIVLTSDACGSKPNEAAAVRAVAARKVNDRLKLAQVGQVTLYRPDGPVRAVALFLSGDGGWNLGVVDMAEALTRQGIAVAGISTPVFQKALETSAEKCVNPNYALTAVGQDFEHQLALPHYMKPILVGYSSGATIAYAALAQAPAGTYRGAVSLGFGPDIGGTKPWCPAPGLTVSRIRNPEAGWLFAPVKQLSAPWLVLQGLIDQVVSPATTKAFTSQIPQAQLIELPKVGHGFSVESHWMPQFTAAFAPMLEAPAASASTPSSQALVSVDDLPLNIVADPAAPHSDFMAVMYSGDGGWAGLDRDVAARFAARGVPVVGVDSLSYFWTAKTPQQAGIDLGRIVNHFSQQWQRRRIILLGYSFGADDLPFIVNAMPPALRPAIARVTLLGLSPTADFQFHLSSWLDVDGDTGLPTVPEVIRMAGVPVQCVKGSLEDGSACPAIPRRDAMQVTLPGGHHFGGNADLIVDTILHGITA